MPNTAEERPPIRIVTRGLAELQTSIMSMAIPLFAGSIDRFAIFTLLGGQQLRAGPGNQRPTSILAMARSLSRPFETVRRNVKRLEAYDLCHTTEQGVVLADDAWAREDLARLGVHAHDCLVRFVGEMIDLGVAPKLRRGSGPYTHFAGLLAASNLMLSIAEGNNAAYSTFADLVIFSAVLACNYRAITADRDLGRRIRNETHLAPADLLKGARPSRIARVLGLPEGTVRRRMIAMLGGQLARRGSEFFVSEPWLNTDGAIRISRNSVARTRRVLNDLALAGFPINNHAAAYVGGTAPAYTVFR